MALRKRKPTSPGRRFQTVSDFSEITKDRPEKSLLGPNPKSGGRNAYDVLCNEWIVFTQATLPGRPAEEAEAPEAAAETEADQ